MKRFINHPMVASRTSASRSNSISATKAKGTPTAPIVYRPPNAWPVDNRTRRFIPLSDRQYSYEHDLEMLRRSIEILLKQQDERGSFYTDKEYTEGDKIDDQLGAASMIAYLLSITGPDKKLITALELGVRFHLDHLLNPPTEARPFWYTRYIPDRDTGYDICNNLWCLWGGALVIRDGKANLSDQTFLDLKTAMAETWSLVFSDPQWAENPCHNQLLALCDVGILYAHAIDDAALVRQLVEFYHRNLRPLRVYDRGYWIFTEFNHWDAHYALLSSSILGFLAVSTGDPAFAEDAEAMALYLNERVSAGGYYWGGSRHNECGFDEFVHVPDKWAIELGLSRLLLAEPSNLWRKFVMDGHWGRALVMRMSIPLKKRLTVRTLVPTPWHFQYGAASVCLADNFKLHHFSSNGLEIIPAANALEVGSGVTWLAAHTWKADPLQVHIPKSSKAQKMATSESFQFKDAVGLCTMQRGYVWETRIWWIASGNGSMWIGQLISHSFPQSEKIEYILGNPVLTRSQDEAVPVTEVESAEGDHLDTQGAAGSVVSSRYLKFGEIYIGGTVPLEFSRPAADAFHTFPLLGGKLWREVKSSNELRLHIRENPARLNPRDSLFFAVEAGLERPSLEASGDSANWKVKGKAGTFEAHQSVKGIWSYTFETASGKQALPVVGFGFRMS